MNFRYLLLFAAILFGLARPTPAAPVPAKDRIVILITVDGFPAWMWKDPALVMPNLRRLVKEGATADAMTVSNPVFTGATSTAK